MLIEQKLPLDVTPQDYRLDDPEVKKTLQAMGSTSTWFHPDLFGEFVGMRHYVHHQYADAGSRHGGHER